MKTSITDKIDKFLVGEEIEDKKIKIEKDEIEEELDEAILEPNEVGIKPGEYNNISTGLRRIQFRLEKANTPQKYVDAFEVIQQLITRFPLKSKIIWQTVANMYQIRFGSANTTTEGETE